MDEQGYKFGVGVLVIASLVIAIILVLFFGAAPNLFARRYAVTIQFEAAPGVTTDTPVRINGVQIGRVRTVQLQEAGKGVNLTLELDSKYQVQAKELPRIGTGSIITGDAVVEFIHVDDDSPSLIERFDGVGGSPADGMLDEREKAVSMAFIQDGDFFKGGKVAPNPLEALLDMQDSMASTMGAIETAGNQVTLLAQDIRGVVGGGDGEFRKITEQVQTTIANFNNTLTSIEAVFGDPKLKNAIATVSDRLPLLVEDADQAINQVGETVAAFEKTANAFEQVGLTAEETIDEVANSLSGVSQTVENVNEITGTIAGQSDEMVGEVRQTIRNLDRFLTDLRGLTTQVNQVARRINNGQGTFAKIVDDPQLYYSIINTLQNVETLTRRLQPIVEDARVLSDKVARDPSTIIRGAILGPRGGIK
jgi:phospholipid/cholesterol/gamma-HCH transport system substrate-binding protein